MNTKYLFFASLLFTLVACGEEYVYFTSDPVEEGPNGTYSVEQSSDTTDAADEGGSARSYSALGLPSWLLDTPLIFHTKFDGPEGEYAAHCTTESHACEIGELVLHSDGSFTWDAWLELNYRGAVDESLRYCGFGSWSVDGHELTLTDEFGAWTSAMLWDNATATEHQILVLGGMVGVAAGVTLSFPSECEGAGNLLIPLAL